MQVTEVRIRRAEDPRSPKLVATASITFDNVFVVHDVRILQGANGLFAAMPRRKLENGNRVDVCHPITNDFRAHIQEAVLGEYERFQQRERTNRR